jgi:RNA polymerase II transcription elongation factor
MASSPAVGLANLDIDPTHQAHYSLQISDNIMSPSAAHDSLYSSVRVNHKPGHSKGRRTTKIRSSGTSATLSITDKEKGASKSYTYSGNQQTTKKYILVFNPSNSTASLQPVSSTYGFNLTKTPTESSAKKLKSQYPQIHDNLTTDSASSPEFDDVGHGSITDDESPDPGNPFDFRHYVHRAPTRHRSPSPSHLAPPSKPTTARDRSISAPQTPTIPMVPRSPSNRPVPTIRMDRKASTRDDGGKSGRAASGKKKTTTSASTEKAKGRAAGKKGSAKEPEKKKVLSQEFIEDSDSDAASAEDITPNIPPSSHSEDDADGEDDDTYLATTSTSAGNAGGGGGGLEIILGEDDIPVPQRKRARTLPHSNPGLPMSLRSAANSPSSQIATPPRQPVSLRGVQEEREDEDDANDAGGWGEESARDEDVVSIDLNATARSAGGMDDEDVDDFEAQLSKAFEVGDLEEVESEESEAE